MSCFFRYLSVLIVSGSLTASVFAQSADLSVVKNGPVTAIPGSDVSYTVVVTNNGPDAASAITLNDAIPAGMIFISATQNSGPPFSCTNPAADTVTCTGAQLNAAESAGFTFVFNIPSSAVSGTVYTNVATVSAVTPDPNSANDSDDAVTTVAQADLSVSKSGPDIAPAGSDVTYTVVVTNNGPDESLSIVLEDDIPAGMTFVSATPPAGFICSNPENQVSCTASSLASGATATFTFVFNIGGDAPQGTTFSNIATITSNDTFDPNAENNSAVAVTSTPFPPQADLGVSKTGPSAAGPGTDVVYTITVRNNGPEAASDVAWNDTLPGDSTFVSLVHDSGPSMNCTTPAVAAGGTVTCTAATYPVGQVSTFSLTVNIPNDAASGTEYNNVVSVSSSSHDPNEENDIAGAGTIVSAVDISVVKSGPGAVTAGTNVAYTIIVSNAGPDLAFGVMLTDELPAGTTLVSFSQVNGPASNCSAPPPGTHGTIACTFDLPAASSAEFALQIDADDTTSITNTAVVTTQSFDTDNSDNTSSVNTTVTRQADLAVTKSGPATVTAGTDLSYTVTLTSNGPSTAADVSLTDNVPVNTTFVSATQTAGPGFTCGHAAGTITCTRASLAPGASATFTFTVHVSPSATGSIDNTANVSTTIADPDGSDNTSNVSSNVLSSADLAVVKSGPSTATPGSNVTYAITATNGGPSTAVNVTLADVLPPGTTFVSATQNSGPVFSCGEAAGTVTCTIASLVPSAPATFTFVFAVSPAATLAIENTATLNSSSTPDPASTNNTSMTTATLGPTADLSVTKTGPAAVTAGSNATYTVTVANAGPSAAANVTLTDTLPSNATFVSATQTSGPTFNCPPPAAGQVVCTIASLAPSAPASFEIVVTANSDAVDALENAATVSSTTPDPVTSNNTATSTAAIDPGPTDLTITKTANGTQFAAGSSVTYTIVVTNNGPGVAIGTTVTDVLPLGTTFESATPSQGSCTGTTTVVCTLGTLQPASSATIALVVTLPLTQGEVSNTASVSAVNSDTNAGNNASTAALAVVSQIPSLSTYGLMLLAMMMAVAGWVTTRMR